SILTMKRKSSQWFWRKLPEMKIPHNNYLSPESTNCPAHHRQSRNAPLHSPSSQVRFTTTCIRSNRHEECRRSKVIDQRYGTYLLNINPEKPLAHLRIFCLFSYD